MRPWSTGLAALIPLALAFACSCPECPPPAEHKCGCTSGEVRECPCIAEHLEQQIKGTQECADDGSEFGQCECPDLAGPADAPKPPSVTSATLSCAPGESVALPEPDRAGGLPLLDALAARRSTREFEDRPLSAQELSGLLWAATGVNRADAGKLTAPTALNWQSLDTYVSCAAGVYRYVPASHSLEPVVCEDRRAAAGLQDFVATAPVNLIFVSDGARQKQGSEEDKRLWGGAHAGFVAQNVYLFAAVNGLGAVVRAYFDGDTLRKALQLRDDQRLVLAQTVGYPKKDK